MSRDTKEFFEGDELASQVWTSKYDMNDGTPDKSIQREVKQLNRINKSLGCIPGYEDLQSYMDGYKLVITGGSIKAGIGVKKAVSLANCFVIPSATDSISGIFDSLKNAAQLYKRRGGVGTDLSNIRPNGAEVNNAAKSSTGVVPVAKLFSDVTGYVCQAGRRGALMLSLHYLHPDILDFINSKSNNGDITNANISVKLFGKDFFPLLNKGEDVVLRFPVDMKVDVSKLKEILPEAFNGGSESNKLHKYKKGFIKVIPASTLWNSIVISAHRSAEPGILFFDNIINESPADAYSHLGFRSVSTNPCGEIPLSPFDSCRLVCVNWYEFVDNPFTPKAKLNINKLRRMVTAAMHVLDNVVNLELEKIEMILKVCGDESERVMWQEVYRVGSLGRRTGLGPTGVADFFAALNLKYDSEVAINLGEQVQKYIAIAAYEASIQLGKIRGKLPYLDIYETKRSKFLNRLVKNSSITKEDLLYRRNLAILTAAPTGTTSIIARTSGGIEPVFKPYMRRAVVVNPGDNVPEDRIVVIDGLRKYIQYTIHPGLIRWYSVKNKLSYSESNSKLNSLTPEELDRIVKSSPYEGSFSHQINPTKKIELQGALQKYIDHSISVTHNLPEDVSLDTVSEVYQLGFNLGLKGQTIYREGSRTGVLDVKLPKPIQKEFKRPKRLECKVFRFINQGKKWIAFISERDGQAYELFTGRADLLAEVPFEKVNGWIEKVKHPDSELAQYDFVYTDTTTGEELRVYDLSNLTDPELYNYGRLISGLLRSELPIPNIYNCILHLKLRGDGIHTWKNGVLRAIKYYIKDGESISEKCPECGGKLIKSEGCFRCSDCGNSKCG